MKPLIRVSALSPPRSGWVRVSLFRSHSPCPCRPSLCGRASGGGPPRGPPRRHGCALGGPVSRRLFEMGGACGALPAVHLITFAYASRANICSNMPPYSSHKSTVRDDCALASARTCTCMHMLTCRLVRLRLFSLGCCNVGVYKYEDIFAIGFHSFNP